MCLLVLGVSLVRVSYSAYLWASPEIQLSIVNALDVLVAMLVAVALLLLVRRLVENTRREEAVVPSAVLGLCALLALFGVVVFALLASKSIFYDTVIDEATAASSSVFQILFQV